MDAEQIKLRILAEHRKHSTHLDWAMIAAIKIHSAIYDEPSNDEIKGVQKFNLSKSQQEKLDKWKSEIKRKHQKYGHFKYSFEPTGIGDIVTVYSEVDNSSIDLSEVENW